MKAILQRAAPFLLGLAFVLQAGWAMRQDASVGDEHPHILAGYLHWKSGHTAGGLGNPPLGQLWIALPLHLSGRVYAFPDDRFLSLARLPVLAVSLLLVWIVWRWGFALGGRRTGLLALSGLALEPNLIAHAHLATLDFLTVVGWWSALWWWRCAATEPARWLRPALVCAVAVGLGALTKFTGIFALPVLALAAAAGVRPGGSVRRAATVLGLAVGAIALLSLLLYRFDPGGLVAGLREKWIHREEVHFAYMSGRRSESGFLAYYLVALGLKTPLALLGLAVWGAWRLPRSDRILLLLPALVLLVVFTLGRVHIGLRHVLAVLPAIVLLAAHGAAGLASKGSLGRLSLLGLALATVIGVGRAAPQYLAYFNVVAGGAVGGHRWLLDSNLDWGQDDRRLAQFLARDSNWEVNPTLQPARPARFAVSANALHNLQRRSDRPYDWLVDWEPVGHAGASWGLYDITLQDFERRAALRPADPLAGIAVAEARAASGDSAGAARAFAATAARFSTDPRVAARAARWALQHGDIPAAAASVRRGFEAGRNDVELQVMAERVRLETAVRAAGSDSAAARAGLDLGIFLAEIGESDAALPWLDRAAAALPDDLTAQGAPGVARARRAEFAAAREVLEASPRRDDLGDEIEACRTWEEAERAVATGANLDPAILHDLGRVQFEAGRLDAAAATFIAILNRNPRDAAALAYLGEAQVRSKLRIAPERLTPRPLH